MSKPQLQPFLTAFFVACILLLSVACSFLEENPQIEAQGRSLAETALANAPTLAANAIDLAQTGVAAAPTLALTAQSLAGTAIAIAPTVALNAKEIGGTAVAFAQQVGSSQDMSQETLNIAFQSIQSRMQQMQVDQNGNLAITFTEADLTAAIQRNEIQNEDARYQNLVVSIRDGLIVVTGDLTRPVNATFAVVFQPYAAEGKLQLNIVEATIGQFQVPAGLVESIEARLNRTLANSLGYLPFNIVITDARANNGVLVLTGSRQ
ncbi:MAG: LmeA family phospholipid-binding protein [Candidatus Promineifilaceae bacterium]